MNNPIIERDVVLIGKNEDGNDTFDFPVTRLANIENDAEIKESPEAGDHFPVIDNTDGGKMKKTSMGGILKPLNTHIGDNTKHVTEADRNAWNGKASGDHDHDGRYYSKTETDTKLNGKSDSLHDHDDRYYTETEIDDKLAKKSDNGHTHAASEISGLPSSLPASGGNADTVDNKHASDFAAAGHTHDDRYYTETETDSKLAEKADKNHTHSNASTTAPGFMSPEDKKKLDGGAVHITTGTIKLSDMLNFSSSMASDKYSQEIELPEVPDLIIVSVNGSAVSSMVPGGATDPELYTTAVVSKLNTTDTIITAPSTVNGTSITPVGRVKMQVSTYTNGNPDKCFLTVSNGKNATGYTYGGIFYYTAYKFN